MNTEDDKQLQQTINQTLDESVQSIDGETLSRIRQIRARVVESSENRNQPASQNWFGVFSGAVATACVLLIVVSVVTQSPDTISQDATTDLDLISSSDSLDLYEDLEFYLWLEDYEQMG